MAYKGIFLQLRKPCAKEQPIKGLFQAHPCMGSRRKAMPQPLLSPRNILCACWASWGQGSLSKRNPSGCQRASSYPLTPAAAIAKDFTPRGLRGHQTNLRAVTTSLQFGCSALHGIFSSSLQLKGSLTTVQIVG